MKRVITFFGGIILLMSASASCDYVNVFYDFTFARDSKDVIGMIYKKISQTDLFEFNHWKYRPGGDFSVSIGMLQGGVARTNCAEILQKHQVCLAMFTNCVTPRRLVHVKPPFVHLTFFENSNDVKNEASYAVECQGRLWSSLGKIDDCIRKKCQLAEYSSGMCCAYNYHDIKEIEWTEEIPKELQSTVLSVFADLEVECSGVPSEARLNL